jgi:hypothetical protein
MANRVLSTIAWITFSTVIWTVCFLLKIPDSTGSMLFRGALPVRLNPAG